MAYVSPYSFIKLPSRTISLSHINDAEDTDSGDDCDDFDRTSIQKYFTSETEGLFLNFPNFKDCYPKIFKNVHRHKVRRLSVPSHKVTSIKIEPAPLSYTTALYRLDSFKSIRNLVRKIGMYAETGFYYLGVNDYIRCYYCGTVISYSNKFTSMDVIVVHMRKQARCEAFFKNSTLGEKLLYSAVRRAMTQENTKLLIECYDIYRPVPTLDPNVKVLHKLIPNMLTLLAKYNTMLLDAEYNPQDGLSSLVKGNNDIYKVYLHKLLTHISGYYGIDENHSFNKIFQLFYAAVRKIAPMELLVTEDMNTVSLVLKLATLLSGTMKKHYLQDDVMDKIVADCKTNVLRITSALPEMNERITCHICLANEIKIAFARCGHCVCVNCERFLPATCPICRQPIEQRLTLYL